MCRSQVFFISGIELVFYSVYKRKLPYLCRTPPPRNVVLCWCYSMGEVYKVLLVTPSPPPPPPHHHPKEKKTGSRNMNERFRCYFQHFHVFYEFYNLCFAFPNCLRLIRILMDLKLFDFWYSEWESLTLIKPDSPQGSKLRVALLPWASNKCTRASIFWVLVAQQGKFLNETILLGLLYNLTPALQLFSGQVKIL